MDETLAFVGVAGGVGTTRLTIETAATLARAGRSVAVIDAAFETQGLVTYAEGRIDPDLTAVVTDEARFSEAIVAVWPDLPGRSALCPAYAPFDRIARAKTTDAAERLATCIDHARNQFDVVLVDVPPVAANQAVAAVHAVDRRVLVAPATERGNDHLPRMRGRLVDVGVDADAIAATFADENTALPDADVAIPTGERDVVTPTAIDPDTAFAPAVASAVEELFDCTLDLEFPDEGFLDEGVFEASVFE